MASSLIRLGHLAVTRIACTKCGGILPNQFTSLVRLQRPRLTPGNFGTFEQVAVNPFSTSASTGGETTEPDDLFRQVTVEIKTHDKAVMKSYTQFVSMAANELGVNLARIFQPPKVINRYTILKSVHIYSKHMVQYEARTHFTVFELKHLTGSTADTFLEYIQRNLPEGMAMKVTKHRLERIPDHLIRSEKTSSTTSHISSDS